MNHEIIKDITCEDATKCSENIIKKIIAKYSEFQPYGLEQNCAITIVHEAGKHNIRIRINTQEELTKIATHESHIQKKFTNPPTKNQLDKEIN